MSFFSTPLSGLSASSAALKSISNNLANLNTDGYKSQSTVFSDVFYQNYGTSGSGNPIQSGLGVKVDGTTSDLTNGALSETGVSSNMALNGNGFFVTKDSSGAMNYTRAGDFTTTAGGQLTTLDGQTVMGYGAPGGVVNPNGPLQALNVGAGTTAPASPTSTFSLTTNLNANSAVGTTFASPISVFDSLGASHVLSVNYTKTANNAWSYDVTAASSEIQGGTGTSTSMGTGTLNFDTSGNLTTGTGTSESLTVGPFNNGATPLNLNWSLVNSSGTPLVTQTASTANNSATTQDGYGAGTLTSFSVLKDGTVEATFTNGQNRAIGQVAIASFANPQGLSMNGNNLYSMTSASGAPVVGTAGSGGRGTIAGSTVEQSNVDVAKEFSNLIVAQRSYEANAKAITAFDQVEQATLAMKN